MHAFYLVMGSVAAHAWAKSIISAAQAIVTFFRASHQPNHYLTSYAQVQGVNRQLQSSNKTRFTSIYLCLLSVHLLSKALQLVVQMHADLFKKQAEVVATITSEPFWSNLYLLVRLLLPFARVIMAIQREAATLGDVTRYFAYLRREIALLLPEMEPGEWAWSSV